METVVGKNDSDNWNIIKESSSDDIWFHLNSFPSPHVITRINGSDEEVDINYAASLCKSKSKYKNVPNIKIVYTSIKNLKLGNKVGSVEFISKRKCKYVVI